MKKNARVILVLIVLLSFLAVGYHPVYASEIIEDGTIETSETFDDDVFLNGDHVVMDGTVNGVLFAAGETVTINGTVNGDAILFGNKVILSEGASVNGNIFVGAQTGLIEGQVSGSLFGGAASISLANNATVERNLYVGTYNFNADAGSSVARDLFAAGYQIILQGKIGRDANVGAGALELIGSIGRNLTANVSFPEQKISPFWFNQMQDLPDPVDPGLRIADTAEIGGKLVYTSEKAQPDSILVEPSDGVVYQTPIPVENKETKTTSISIRYPVLNWFFNFLRTLVTLLVFGGLALWLIPLIFERVVDQVRARPAPAAGYGLLTIFSGYFGALAAAVVILIVGFVLGLLSLGSLASPVFGVGFSALAFALAIFSFLISIGSKLVVAYLVGWLLIEKIAPQTKNRTVWAMVIGVVIYTFIVSIPFIGWLFAIAATLVGVGAMWLAYRTWRKPIAA